MEKQDIWFIYNLVTNIECANCGHWYRPSKQNCPRCGAKNEENEEL